MRETTTNAGMTSTILPATKLTKEMDLATAQFLELSQTDATPMAMSRTSARLVNLREMTSNILPATRLTKKTVLVTA